MNAGERPAEDRRNALYMRAQQNSEAARLTVHFGVVAGLTAVLTTVASVSFFLKRIAIQMQNVFMTTSNGKRFRRASNVASAPGASQTSA